MVTDETFKSEISQGAVLVAFWSPGCPPCHLMMPAVDHLAKSYEGRIKVRRAKRGDNTEMAELYDVKAFPQFILFCDGQEVKRLVGSVPYATLEQAITEVLNGRLVCA